MNQGGELILWGYCLLIEIHATVILETIEHNWHCFINYLSKKPFIYSNGPGAGYVDREAMFRESSY